MDLAVGRAVRVRNPTLDGLRGFALAGMLAWHAQVAWVAGGFARMTIFFVLSGFLSTRSILRRPERGFVAFWKRRTIRLLPVTLVGVIVAIATTVAIGSTTTQASLRGDAWSVLTYTSNWRFLSDGQGYGELFERESAFQHYWSLSIEEQCFLLLPLVLGLAMWLGRHRRRAVGWLVGGAALTFAAIPAVLPHSADQVYFGTHTRLAEFLGGAWLAIVLCDTRRVRNLQPEIRWLGRLSLLALAVVMVTIERDQAWLYEGGMAVFVLPAAAVIAAASTGDRFLERTLGVWPLRTLGQWALSVYAMHWPVYLLVDELWPATVDRRFVVAAQLVLGIAAGGIVHHLVERPLLPGDTVTTRPRRIQVGVPVPALAAVGVVLAASVLLVDTASPPYDFAAAELAFDTESIFIAPVPDPPVEMRTVAVFGGSTALQNGLGVGAWADGSEGLVSVAGDARLGCGLFQNGSRVEARNSDGTPLWVDVDPACEQWAPTWAASALQRDVDVAIVFFGVWEISDWRFAESNEIVHIGQPVVDTRVRQGLATAVRALREGGVDTVVLATVPEVGPGTDGDAVRRRGLDETDHRARIERYNTLVRAIAADTGATVFDYGELIDDLRPDEHAWLVPDGVHPTWDASVRLWERGLGARLVTLLDGR